MEDSQASDPDDLHHHSTPLNTPLQTKPGLATSDLELENYLKPTSQPLQQSLTTTLKPFTHQTELGIVALPLTEVQHLKTLDLDEYGESFGFSPLHLSAAKNQNSHHFHSDEVIPVTAKDGGQQGFVPHPNTNKTHFESLKTDKRTKSYSDPTITAVTVHPENRSDFLAEKAAPSTANNNGKQGFVPPSPRNSTQLESSDSDTRAGSYEGLNSSSKSGKKQNNIIHLVNGTSRALAKGNDQHGSVPLPAMDSLPLEPTILDEYGEGYDKSPSHISAGKIQVVEPNQQSRKQGISYKSALLNQKAPAHSTSTEQNAPVLNVIPIRSAKMINGCLTLSFSKKEIDIMALPFKWALVGKFPSGRPLIDRIRGSFGKLRLKGNHRISLLDRKHVLIELNCEEDHLRIWSSRGWNIDGKLMRIFRWTTTFRGNEESPVVPLWVSFPFLPCHLARCRTALFSLAGTVGKPIRADPATLIGSRPTVARVLVEEDVSKTIPKRVWIDSEEDSFAQEIITEKVPKYCPECRLLGHSKEECYISQPEKRKDNKQKKQTEQPKTDTAPTKKTSGPLIETEEQEICDRFLDTVMAAIESAVAGIPKTVSNGTTDHEIPTLAMDTAEEPTTIMDSTTALSSPAQLSTGSSSSSSPTKTASSAVKSSPSKHLTYTLNRETSSASTTPSSSPSPMSAPSPKIQKQRKKCPSEPDASVGDPEDKMIIGYTHTDIDLHPRLKKRYPKIGPNRFEVPMWNAEEAFGPSSEDSDEDPLYQPDLGKDLEEDRHNRTCAPNGKWKKPSPPKPLRRSRRVAKRHR